MFNSILERNDKEETLMDDDSFGHSNFLPGTYSNYHAVHDHLAGPRPLIRDAGVFIDSVRRLIARSANSSVISTILLNTLVVSIYSLRKTLS